MGAKIRTLFLCLSASAALTGPAAAQERLVMPFSCSLDSGTVSLAPAAPQPYKIYGRLEKKRLTTCCPLDPRNCHTWFVYRFDLDCGGRRTNWQSVVAALSINFADAPATREETYTGRYGGARRIPPWAPGRPARPCRPGLGPAVDFPPGFAPNPMRVATFEQASSPPANVPLPPKKPVSAAPPTQTAETAEIVSEFEPAAQAAQAAPDAKTDASTEATGTAEATDRPATNADKVAAAKSESTKSKPPKPEHVEIALFSGNSEATGSLPKSATPSSTLWRDAGLIFSVTFTALLALTVLLLFRRRGTETIPIPFARPALKRITRSLFTGTSNSGPESAETQGHSEAPASSLRLWDEGWLRATKSEALEVLGVDPGARPATMKTTVTRLRRALHPDHALDEEDRVLRERRLKQINVAWDIVSGNRHAS